MSHDALAVMSTHDTTLDASRHDASVRAAKAGWCTDTYAQKLMEFRPRAAPGAEWNTWASHKAYTTASLKRAEQAGRPADSATRALRQWAITTTPHGRDGWTGQPTTSTAYVELTRSADNAPWRVAAVSIQ